MIPSIRPTMRRTPVDTAVGAPTSASRRAVRLPRMTRGRALVMSLVVLLGGTLAAAASSLGSGSPVAPVAAAQPLPLPTGDPDPCGPGSPPMPICTLPTLTTTAPMTRPLNQSATPSKSPCTGAGCIPQPGTTAPPTNPGSGQPGQGDRPSDDCGITDIGACVTEATNAFFRGIVTEALNPLLDLLSKTLLTTPMPDSLPRVGELWDNSWQILLVSYGLLVLIAGVIVMGYQTVQTRHSVKEIAPRLVVGFLAGALSLWVATKGIEIANALVAAIMSGGVDAAAAAEQLRNMAISSTQQGGMFILLIGLTLTAMLVALLVSYIVRVALTIVLIVGAPLALMFHALPQTEGIAYWWWKAYGGCLAIQLAQSLTLITAMKVFLAPGGFTLFGPTISGLVNLLVALALMYILFKIPFWILSSIRGSGGGRSLIGSLVKGFLAYKTFGLLRGGGGGGKGSKPRPSGGNRGGGSDNGGVPNLYANPRATSNGQYMLPLSGVRRTTSTAKPRPTAGPKPSSAKGRQLALPLDKDWPENKPVLGRDGQYRLPLDVQRTTAPPTPPAQTGGRRPTRKGGVQLELPFDPYKGNRPTRSGQYPLPLDGVRRVPTPTPAPSLPPAAAPRPTPRTGRQLRLPLDLPKPPRFSPPQVPRPSPKPGS